MIDLATLPHTPGCYLFSDASGGIIYIGKAKDLKKRVTSYFQKKDHDAKTEALVANVVSFDLMITNTETEALILENTLIKKHQPHYNIDLKDAKRFAYIELTRNRSPGSASPGARTGAKQRTSARSSQRWPATRSSSS